MEFARDRIMQQGLALAEIPLGKTRPPPPAIPLPRTNSSLHIRRPSVTQIPPIQTSPETLHPPATARARTLPTEQPVAGPSSLAPRTAPAAPSSKATQPRITTKDWSAPDLCQRYDSFEPVRRVSALSSPEVLSQALEKYERDGIPLVIEDWHKHHSWPRDIFSLEWLLQTSGGKNIQVRNMHDRRDQPMTLAEFVNKSRSQSVHCAPGEAERLYWKDADCPLAWREWLLKSSPIPADVLPGSPDDYLGYLSPSEAVESLLCYMGIGDTYTAAHKDLCSSSGHNLMCFSENNGASFWFMTAAHDAAVVAKYFHKKLKQELDWETHVTTLEELGDAPFAVYVVEQKVGDLVLVPPRSCHQVVNAGGLAMKTSWSRITLDGLRTALHCELPIYRRVCRQEQYRVRTVLYRSVLHLTEALQTALSTPQIPKAEPQQQAPVPSSADSVSGSQDAPFLSALVNYADSAGGLSSRAATPAPAPAPDVHTQAQKLKRLVQLFDEVLRDEFAACHAKLQHVLRSETSAGWALTARPGAPSGKDGNVARPRSSQGLKLKLQPPADSLDRRESDRAKERSASCNLACDFCGADIFQSFFECKRCRTSEDGSPPAPGDGLLLCPACYVEGRICECRDMTPMQCRPFDMLLSDRNDAVKALASALPSEDALPEFRCPNRLPAGEDSWLFEAACALHDYRIERAGGLAAKLQCRPGKNPKEVHYVRSAHAIPCPTCHKARCFNHVLALGIHSSTALLLRRVRRDDGAAWHAFHVAKTAALRRGESLDRLFDLDSVKNAAERLAVAARSFRKCRPGHEKVRLGFYDRESGAEDLMVDEPEPEPEPDAVPATPTMLNAGMNLAEKQLSPLTPVNSSDEGGSLFGSPVHDVPESRLALAPRRRASSSDTVIDEEAVEAEVDVEVIEVEYSDSEGSGHAAGRASAAPNGAYVSVPPLPRYASVRKRAPSPSREESGMPQRKKPKSASVRDPEHAALIRRPKGLERAESSARHRSHSSGDKTIAQTSMPRVADNTGAYDLVKALNSAAGPPATIKKPRIGILYKGVPRIDSDSERTPSPPPRRDSTETSVPDLNLAYPDTEDSARASLAGSIAPHPAQESALAVVPAPLPLPRPAMLKRSATDASLEPDSSLPEPAPKRTTASSLAALGRIPKKRRGPPGIPQNEVPTFAEEQASKESEEHEEDVPLAKGKSKVSARSKAPQMRPSRSSDSRPPAARRPPEQAESMQGAQVQPPSDAPSAYFLPDADASQASASVSAAIAPKKTEDAPVHATFSRPVSEVPQPRPLLSSASPSTSAAPVAALVAALPPALVAALPPAIAPAAATSLAAIPQPPIEATPPVEGASPLEQAINSLRTYMPVILNHISSVKPGLDEADVATLRRAVEELERKVVLQDEELAKRQRLADRLQRYQEKQEQLEQELDESKAQRRFVEEELKKMNEMLRKEREERSHMSMAVRSMQNEVRSLNERLAANLVPQPQEDLSELVKSEVQAQLQQFQFQQQQQQAPFYPTHQPHSNFGGGMHPGAHFQQMNQPRSGGPAPGTSVGWPQQNNGTYHNAFNRGERGRGPHGPSFSRQRDGQGSHHGYRGSGINNGHGRDNTSHVNNWVDRNRNRDSREDMRQGRERDWNGERDMQPRPPSDIRGEPARTFNRERSRSPDMRGRRPPNADESPVSEFSDRGGKRTPPSTIESYPSPCEPSRSHSSIQNSSFTDINEVRPPPSVPRAREGSSYPSPREDTKQEEERHSRSSSRALNGERPSRSSSRAVDMKELSGDSA